MAGRTELPRGTLLDASYRIESMIGSGGFGITYEAQDVRLGTKVAIKEYYPTEFGQRDASLSVRPTSGKQKETFEWGRASFLQEARTLARFRHPSVVQVTRVFEAHSTAYMVMNFEEGPHLGDWLERLGRPPTQVELDRIAGPLLDALEMMHGQGFLHRDISPDNIIVRSDGTPILLDFGAARRAVAEMSHALTGIVKSGYSPYEQYAADGRLQGTWTDIYALGATLYRAVTGKPPEEATLRVMDDRLLPTAHAAMGAYRPAFLSAIDACLKVKPAERPQSVSELRPMLVSVISGSAPRIAETRKIETVGKTQGRLGLRAGKLWLTGAGVMAVLAGLYGGYEVIRRTSEQRIANDEAKRLAEAAAARKKNEEEAIAKARATRSEPFRFLAQSSWDENCVADPLPQVTVISPPKHGTISFGEGNATITQIIGDKKCMGSSIRSRLVYYAPSGGQAAIDQVSLEVVSSRGNKWGFDCTIYVLGQNADCQLRK
jgi:Protein kinase domain